MEELTLEQTPSSKGTWPAIWTLGSNIDEIGITLVIREVKLLGHTAARLT